MEYLIGVQLEMGMPVYSAEEAKNKAAIDKLDLSGPQKEALKNLVEPLMEKRFLEKVKKIQGLETLDSAKQKAILDACRDTRYPSGYIYGKASKGSLSLSKPPESKIAVHTQALLKEYGINVQEFPPFLRDLTKVEVQVLALDGSITECVTNATLANKKLSSQDITNAPAKFRPALTTATINTQTQKIFTDSSEKTELEGYSVSVKDEKCTVTNTSYSLAIAGTWPGGFELVPGLLKLNAVFVGLTNQGEETLSTLLKETSAAPVPTLPEPSAADTSAKALTN